MRKATHAAIAVLVWALLAIPATAAPMPLVTDVSPDTASHPHVAVDSQGRATVASTTRSPTAAPVVQVVRLDADGIPGPAQLLTSTTGQAIAEDVVVDSLDRATVAWIEDVEGTVVRASRLSAEGVPGPVLTLSGPGVVLDLDLFSAVAAVDAQGRVTVVWARSDGTNARVESAQIDAQGMAGTVSVLSEAGQDASSPSLAVDADGRATIAWLRSDGANARVQAIRLASDGTPGSIQTLSAAGQDASRPDVAVDAQGRATIVFYRAEGPDVRVQSVRLGADGTPGGVQTHTAAAPHADGPKVAVDTQGRATIVWSRQDGGSFRVEAVRLAEDGTPGAVKTLSASGQRQGIGPEVAVDEVGRANVIWRLREGDLDRVQSTRLTANGVPGVTATLSEQGISAQEPKLALDHRGRATVVWSLRPTVHFPEEDTVQASRLNAPAFDGPFCLVEPTVVSVGRTAPIAIPDNNPAGISDTISLSSAGVIADVDVTVNIAHTRSDDLDISLTAPDGTAVVLSTGNGSGSGNFAGTTFDDQGPSGISDAFFQDGITELHAQPEGALDALRGRTAAGSWRLSVSDNAVADAGSLVGWELAVTTVAELPESFPTDVSGTGGPIADDNLTSFQLDVDGAPPALLDSILHTTISHGSPGDLSIFLTSPSGAQTTISTGNGGSADDAFAGTAWDDFAPDPVTDATFTDGVVRETLIPEGAMAAFVGEDPNGTWTLDIYDDVAGVAGTLEDWSLSMLGGCGEPPVVEEEPPTDPTGLTDPDVISAAIAGSQLRFPDVSGFAGVARTADFAVLARVDVFADALGGSVLLGDAPLLFTPSDSLDERTAAELTRLGVDTVYLLGGEVALDASVASAVAALGVTDVNRLAGPSRIETSIEVARAAAALGLTPGDRWALARASGPADNPTAAWADSVSGGGYAARAGVPIVLNPTGNMHPAVQTYMDELQDAYTAAQPPTPSGIPQAITTYLLGGPAALSDAVEQVPVIAVRVSGSNRFATAVAIARERLEVFTTTAVRGYHVIDGTAENGWNYGLIAAGLVADTGQPILMVGSTTPPETLTEVAGCDEQVTLIPLGVLAADVLEELSAADQDACT